MSRDVVARTEPLSPGVVTVAVPVYHRLQYLPGALRSVARQDYPHIDLLVSDNGRNGPEVEELVRTHYPRPFRFRRNSETVEITDHYNQLVDAAEGEYFVLLADDDEIGPGFVRHLFEALSDESVGVAIARLEPIDEAGEVRQDGRRADPPPARMSTPEFVRSWCRNEYPYVCFCTTLARTAEVRAAGGYPVFPKGTSVDNALLLKLALGREVAFVDDATFRYRVYEESHGLALGYKQLARDLNAFLAWLDSDPGLQRHAHERPREWGEMRALLVEMTWRTYRNRWAAMYSRRLSRTEWVRAAFALRFIPAYYREVLRVLFRKIARRAVPGS